MKITEGRGNTRVLVGDISLAVSYYYEEAIRGTDDEPPCNEYFEIYSVTLGDVEVIDWITDKGLSEIEILLRKQSAGYITERFVDNDSLRPPVSAAMQRVLGHELNNYDWSDK